MTEIPDRMMFDNDALNYLQENEILLTSVTEADVELYTTIFQYNEFTRGVDDLSPEKRDIVPAQINKVLKESQLETTTIETSGYGEAYGYNYTGSTGEVFEELIQPHPNIKEIQRADAVGAEAAINRSMPFVTGDGGLKDKMREYGYQRYLLPLDELCELFEE